MVAQNVFLAPFGYRWLHTLGNQKRLPASVFACQLSATERLYSRRITAVTDTARQIDSLYRRRSSNATLRTFFSHTDLAHQGRAFSSIRRPAMLRKEIAKGSPRGMFFAWMHKEGFCSCFRNGSSLAIQCCWKWLTKNAP